MGIHCPKNLLDITRTTKVQPWVKLELNDYCCELKQGQALKQRDLQILKCFLGEWGKKRGVGNLINFTWGNQFSTSQNGNNNA